MGYDFSGGNKGASTYGNEYVSRIRNQDTDRQRSRNLNEKLIMAAVQVALTGGRAAAGASEHADHVKKTTKAKLDAEAKAPLPDYRPMDSRPTDARVPAWLTGGEGDRTELAVDNDVLAALKPEPPSNPYDTAVGAGKSAAAYGRVSAARSTAPVATWFTPDGAKKVDDDSDAIARDMARAEEGMRGGR